MTEGARFREKQQGRVGNRIFANRVLGFVNRARNLPGLPIYFAGGAAAILLMTTSGAFATLDLPLPKRLAFWSLLIGTNLLLWIGWFAWRVRSPRDWWPSVLLGTLVINLPLPVEIAFLGRLLGVPMTLDWARSWTNAGLISLALLIILFIAIRRHRAIERPQFPKGSLWRAGFRNLADVAWIVSEDHYCRIGRPDGNTSLLHARFTDLAKELETVDGAVLRRGHWAAASAVEAIERRNRKWHVILKNGPAIAVSAAAATDLRSRGWL